MVRNSTDMERFDDPITTKAEYDRAMKIIKDSMPRTDFTEKEIKYIQRLADLIIAYENIHYPLED